MYLYTHERCFLWGQNKPEVNYSFTRNLGTGLFRVNIKQEDAIGWRTAKKCRRNITATRFELGK